MVVGIDLAESMVARLRHEITRRDLTQAEVQLMDAQNLGFPDAYFDCVLCGFAIDLLPHPEEALSEFRRVLLAGGRLSLSLSPGWWWEGDERWSWHAELLRSLGAEVRLGRTDLDSSHEVKRVLRRGGFADVATFDERFELTWADPDEWWRWGWSHGWRRVLEGIERNDLARYRATCVRELQSMALRFGEIAGRLKVLLAVGTRETPGGVE